MSLETRVFNPRGKRADGGGLIAQVVISADEVDSWCRPSAIERARFARSFDRVTFGLRREVEAVLLAEAARRDAQDRAVALGEPISLAVDAHDDVAPGTWGGVADGGGVRQTAESAREGSGASPVSTPGASTPAA